MSKIFDIDFRTGSTIEKYSKSKGVNVGNKITKQEKGLVYAARQSNSGQITYPAADMTALNFGTNPFSLVCAFKMGKFVDAGSSLNVIFAKGWFSNGMGGIGICFGNDQNLIFRWENISGIISEIKLDDFGSLYDGKYHLAILTFDGITYKAFLDNIQETTISTDVKNINTLKDLFIGRDGNINRRSNSDIVYIRAYNHLLTTQERNKLYKEFQHSFGLREIKRNFSYPKPTDLSNEEGLVAAYNMIPSNGKLVDISGNGNDGTIEGNILATKDGIKLDGVVGNIIKGSNLELKESKCSVFFRIKPLDVTTNSQRIIRTLGAGTNRFYFLISPDSISITRGSTPIGYTISFIKNKYYDFVYTWNNGVIRVYINGVLAIDSIYTPVVGAGDANLQIGTITLSESNFNGIITDFKIYDYFATPEQAKAYHNSFIKPYLLEYFSGNGADGIVKTPRGWVKDTGEYKVEELALEQNNLLSDVFLAKGSGSSSITLINNYTVNIKGYGDGSSRIQPYIKFDNLEVGKRYKIKATPTLNSGTGNFSFYNGYEYVYSYDTPLQSFEYEFTKQTGDPFLGSNAKDYSFDIDWHIEVYEIPPLEDLTTGTKYLENVTAGTTAIQSKQAYGEWEWDLFKGSTANLYSTSFIGNNIIANPIGYRIWAFNDNSILLRKETVGSTLFRTPASYIDNNTWYKIKVVRLKSEGVFKDIPTLQTNDCENGVSLPYTTFTSNGRCGFSVTSDGSSQQIAGTADEIDLINGEKYLVVFDLQLNNGTAPTVQLGNSLNSVSQSNAVQSQDGHNSIILTANTTTTGVVSFYNMSTTTDYTISNLTIKRIYPKDTFAVFIKGGDFGNDEWTLVDPTGGSGTNPVTDSTYTTSNYFVADLDAGDRFTNLKIMDGVKQ